MGIKPRRPQCSCRLARGRPSIAAFRRDGALVALDEASRRRFDHISGDAGADSLHVDPFRRAPHAVPRLGPSLAFLARAAVGGGCLRHAIALNRVFGAYALARGTHRQSIHDLGLPSRFAKPSLGPLGRVRPPVGTYAHHESTASDLLLVQSVRSTTAQPCYA